MPLFMKQQASVMVKERRKLIMNTKARGYLEGPNKYKAFEIICPWTNSYSVIKCPRIDDLM
jgi:hypothetical protein